MLTSSQRQRSQTSKTQTATTRQAFTNSGIGAATRAAWIVISKAGLDRGNMRQTRRRTFSAFLCAEWGFDAEVRHAGYIPNWNSLLKADGRAFFTAASGAQRAADYLRGLAIAEELPITGE
jgi:Zincin-like metallopeptidase